MSRSYLSDIETGSSSPTLESMDRIAKAVGIDLCYLLSDSLSISQAREDTVIIASLSSHPAITIACQSRKKMGRPRGKY